MFESYCLLTVLDLVMNVGLGLLINGVAGALAALECGEEKKSKLLILSGKQQTVLIAQYEYVSRSFAYTKFHLTCSLFFLLR